MKHSQNTSSTVHKNVTELELEVTQVNCLHDHTDSARPHRDEDIAGDSATCRESNRDGSTAAPSRQPAEARWDDLLGPPSGHHAFASRAGLQRQALRRAQATIQRHRDRVQVCTPRQVLERAQRCSHRRCSHKHCRHEFRPSSD